MGNKVKAYGTLILGLIGFFMLGAYADSQFKHGEIIETFRWGLTGGFALMFIEMAIQEFRKL